MASPLRPDRHFARPHRPLSLRAANAAGPLVGWLRPGRLSLDRARLEADARRATELDDFGTDRYGPALDALLDALETEARLTPAGRWFARGQVLTGLTNRLRLQATWSATPAILDQPITAPLVIIGLPRSGTTLLQHLLAQDPEHRVLRNWEAANPTPPPEPGVTDDPRIAATERGMRLLDHLAPDARVLHPVGATLPTECVTLFSNSFASLELATINFIPSYLRFCLSEAMDEHYRTFVRQLQVLQWKDRRPRWLLKSPAHLFWVDELLAALPGARLIQTHRDPLQVLASFCSLSAVLCGIGSDHVDQHALGALWAPTWAEGLERAAAARRRHGDTPVVDVQYPELVADPLGTVRRIYAGFGLDLTAEAERRMSSYLASHPQHAGGVHRYSLEQFGLDPAREAERFASYRQNLAP